MLSNRKLQVLAANKILSAPVIACSEGDAPDDCTDVIGFMDIRDALVSFLAGESRCAVANSATLCLKTAWQMQHGLCMSCRAGLAAAQKSANAPADASA